MSSSENGDSKIKEYAKKLEQIEALKAEKAKLFNPLELAKSSREIRSTFIEGVGEIRYGPLTVADMLEISKTESDEERGILIMWLMLRKAYPELKMEDVKAFPMDTAAKILTALTANLDFLANQKQLPNG